MSISPPSDIVLDVVNAVDPTKQAIALKRLETLALTKSSGGEKFSETLQSAVASSLSESLPFHTKPTKGSFAGSLPNATLATQRGGQESKLKKAHQKLEGVFLQGIITSMLSAQKDKLFGDGIAGTYWKSFMAEAIANQLSDGGGVGIADKLSSREIPQGNNRKTLVSVTDTSSDYKNYFHKIFLDELAPPSSPS